MRKLGLHKYRAPVVKHSEAPWPYRLYVAFQRVLQLVLLLFRSTEFKELEIVVLRHELAVLPSGWAANFSVSRPMVLGGCGAAVAEGQVVVVSCHAGYAFAVASAPGGETVDVRKATRSTAD